MDYKILIVEDDLFLRDGLEEMLKKESYAVCCAKSCVQARAALSADSFSLIIIDVMLPDGNGFDLCSALRSNGNATPIMFLTACDDEIQIVRGLDAGADDYVTKPFKLRELLSRVKALLRRKSEASYSSGDISVNLQNMSVKKNGEPVLLTPTEFQLLWTLMKNNGIIVTRASLLGSIWDDAGSFIDDNTLSVHISRLREKIGAERIATVRGIGYRWESML